VRRFVLEMIPSIRSPSSDLLVLSGFLFPLIPAFLLESLFLESIRYRRRLLGFFPPSLSLAVALRCP